MSQDLYTEIYAIVVDAAVRVAASKMDCVLSVEEKELHTDACVFLRQQFAFASQRESIPVTRPAQSEFV